jgi:hypothetical protein
MNAYAERFVRSIESECLDQMILVGRENLGRTVVEYAAHYHDEHSHQGIGNEIVSGAIPQVGGAIETGERLGGLDHIDPAGPLEFSWISLGMS